MTCRTVHFLLVEDDDVDMEAVERALSQAETEPQIINATNGLEALKMLRGDEGYTPIPRPYLILLDINMPYMNGFELLQAIRSDSQLKNSIVFVLTHSNHYRDIKTAYNSHISGYILKERISNGGTDFAMMMNLFQRLVEFPSH